MLHYEALRQLTHDRGERLRHQAAAERLARQARGRQQLRLGVDEALIRRLQARGYLRSFGLTELEVRRRLYAAHLAHRLAEREQRPRRRSFVRSGG